MLRYKHRIFVYVSSQHLNLAGGIGTTVRAFLNQAKEQDWIVDIILDRPARDLIIPILDAVSNNVNFWVPESPLDYALHNKRSMHNDRLNTSKIVNFQESQMRALGKCLPEMLIVHTVDALAAVVLSGLHTRVPCVHYTHVMTDWGNTTYHPSYLDMQRLLMQSPGLVMGTQSVMNKKRVIADLGSKVDVRVLPIPLAEESILEITPKNKSGVLYNGRFEPGKDPKEFLRVVSETGLQAKVLTNRTGAAKFRAKFEELGIKNFVIKNDIAGTEKAEFILSAKVGYLPSKYESFGCCALESLAAHPTFLLRRYGWYKPFIKLGVEVIGKEDAVDRVRDAHDHPDKEFEHRRVLIRSWQSAAKNAWVRTVESLCSQTLSRVSGQGRGKIFEEVARKKMLDVGQYYWNILGRETLSYSDFDTLYNNLGRFKVVQTKDKTYLAKKD